MKKKILPVLFLFSSALGFAQTQLNGVTFPDTYTAGTDKLMLNGGGVREKYWMDMYVCALYLPAKSKDGDAIVADNSSMMIRLFIVSGLITSQRMRDAVEEGIKRSTGGKQEVYKDKISQFEKAFSDEIKKGDVFDIVYTGENPSVGRTGIQVYKNSVMKGEVEGLDFKKAVFGIWLGKDPVDSALKEKMLGKTN